MKTCETCRFWSNEQAQSIDWGPLEALCLSQYSPNRTKMTKESDTCACWSENTRGAVDDPNAGPYLEAEQPPKNKTLC